MTAVQARGGDAWVRELAAGQAQTVARFDEVFRRLNIAEGTAGEARDLAKEIITILREQDSLARIAEARAEAQQMVAALRQDVVHANTGLKSDVASLGARVDALETLRDTGMGAAKGAQWLWNTLSALAGGGGVALLLKFMEMAK